jgi:lipoyl(octanoyl) transferase
LGLPVEIKEYAGETNSQNLNPVCFEVPSSYEITVAGKKLIGSAQARKKEGVLQHGSLPLTGDLTRICDALVFKDEASRKNAAERLLTRATTVESVFPGTARQGRRGVETDWETAAQAFVKGFEAQLGIRFQRGELSRSESERTDELVKEKYANPAWTERI